MPSKIIKKAGLEIIEHDEHGITSVTFDAASFKYSGYTFEEVIDKNSGYLVWFVGQEWVPISVRNYAEGLLLDRGIG